MRSIARKKISAGLLLTSLWGVAALGPWLVAPSSAVAQRTRVVPSAPESFAPPESFVPVPASDDATIDDLLQRRVQQEWTARGMKLNPELIKVEANYIRTSVTATDNILWAGSFQLQPRYYSHAPEGADSMHRAVSQPVMYYTGSVRSPLALPVVSNLSNALNGDEASYTVNLGILPLPSNGKNPDSIRYYVVIERAIESNRSDDIVRLERFAKEFTTKADEPIPLRLENEVPQKGLYILKLENGQVLDFYDDFARFIEEHILLQATRLHFELGKQTISDISSRLSIPFSVASTANVKLQLLSIVDTAHPLTLVDTIRQPADYLAELDMSKFIDGPYRYKLTATDPTTGAVLFAQTKDFRKSQPVYVSQYNRIAPYDTIQVGGKKVDWEQKNRELNALLSLQTVKLERVEGSVATIKREKDKLLSIVEANTKNSIADIHGRAGLGVSVSAGDNVFVGIEASQPSVALDVSFGFMYGKAPFLDYTQPQNFSQFTSSPKSLGIQLSYIPYKFFNGIIEPTVGFGYYGIWSEPSTPSGLRSATLLTPFLGLSSEPLGELNGLGISLTYELITGLGLSQSGTNGLSFRAYVRF